MNACSIDQRLPADRQLGVGSLVGVQHHVDRGVAHGVRGDPPAALIEQPHDLGVPLTVHRLQTAERSTFAPRFLVRLAHQPAFEAAVHRELDAANAKPRVAVALVQPGLVQRPGHSRGIAARPQQRIDAHRQQSALLQVLETAIVVHRDARMPNGRESDGVQRLVLGDARRHLLVTRARRWRRQRDQRARGINQLAVQAPVRITSQPSAFGVGRLVVNTPAAKHRGVDDVFVPAPDKDHRMIRRDAIEVVAEWQALFLQLGFVPVAVRDDGVAGHRGLGACTDGGIHVVEGAGA